MTESRPTPYELWQQAKGDGDAYIRLMIKHGHLIPSPPVPPMCFTSCGCDGRQLASECSGRANNEGGCARCGK